MSLLEVVCLFSFMILLFSFLFNKTVKDTRSINKNKERQSDQLFTNDNYYSSYLEDIKIIRKWSFIVFVISGILLIMSEVLRNEVS